MVKLVVMVFERFLKNPTRRLRDQDEDSWTRRRRDGRDQRRRGGRTSSPLTWSEEQDSRIRSEQHRPRQQQHFGAYYGESNYTGSDSAQGSMDSDFKMKVGLIHKIIKANHHLQLVSRQSPPRFINKLTWTLNTAIKPASSLEATRKAIEDNAKQWQVKTMIILKEHHLKVIDEEFIKLLNLPHDEWQSAFQAAATRAKNSLNGRLSPETVKQTEMLIKAKLKDRIMDQQQSARTPQSRQAQSTARTVVTTSLRSVALSPRIKHMEKTREKKKERPLTLNCRNILRQNSTATTQMEIRTEHNIVETQPDAPKKRKSSIATQTAGSPQHRSRQTAKTEVETSLDRSGASMVLNVPHSLDLSTFILPKQVTINMELPWQAPEGGNSSLKIPVELLWQFQPQIRTE